MGFNNKPANGVYDALRHLLNLLEVALTMRGKEVPTLTETKFSSSKKKGPTEQSSFSRCWTEYVVIFFPSWENTERKGR